MSPVTGLGPTLLRGAAASPFKRPGRPGAVLPATRLSRPAAPVAAAPLARYRQICRFPATGPLP